MRIILRVMEFSITIFTLLCAAYIMFIGIFGYLSFNSLEGLADDTTGTNMWIDLFVFFLGLMLFCYGCSWNYIVRILRYQFKERKQSKLHTYFLFALFTIIGVMALFFVLEFWFVRGAYDDLTVIFKRGIFFTSSIIFITSWGLALSSMFINKNS